MIYIGTLGRMIGIKCPASQQVTNADRYSFETTLEGRVKAQARPIGRRVWALGHSDATTPADTAILQDFANGAWGIGPFLFISAEAPVTNLLTPAVAEGRESQPTPSNVLATNPEYAVIAGGPVQLGDSDWAPASLTVNPTYGVITFNLGIIPALEGVTVTGSVWVKGAGASVRLYWYNANGTYMQVTPAAGGGAGDKFTRLSVSARPPAGAAGVRVGVTQAVAATRPALTWTEKLQPWANGRGCEKAVVHDASNTLTLAALGQVYESSSFTVTEVG